MPLAPSSRATPVHRRKLVKAGIALATAGLFVLLAGCSSSGSTSSSSSAANSTLTIVEPDNDMGWAVDYAFSGLEQDINTQATLLKKPYVQTSQTGVETQNTSVFDPYLAKSVTVSPNGLVYTFHLSNAISAHGNPLTAEDVLWSFQRKFYTPTAIAYGAGSPVLYNPNQQIKVIDTHTVSFTIARAGYGAQLKALLSDLIGEIYDATWLKQHATKSDPYAVKWSATHPNFGFGPYYVQSWNESSGATLTARSNFVLGEPKVKKIIVRIVPDSGARVAAVEAGTADIAENVDPAASAQAKSNPNVIVPEVADSNQYIELPLVTNKAPFNNVKVRQAMAYAVPYSQIIKNVFHGLAVRNGSGFLDRKAPGYTGTGLPNYTYDPAKAKALLKAAGVTTPVKFALTVSASDSDMTNAAIQIQSAASAAGFDITINKISQTAFNLQRSDHSSQAFILRDYAITMVPGYELTVYTAPPPNDGNNFADWVDPAFQAAVAKGYTYPDAFSTEAGKAWNAAEQIYINQSPIVFIGQTQPSVLLNKRVAGYATRSDQWIDYDNLTLSK